MLHKFLTENQEELIKGPRRLGPRPKSGARAASRGEAATGEGRRGLRGPRSMRDLASDGRHFTRTRAGTGNRPGSRPHV